MRKLTLMAAIAITLTAHASPVKFNIIYVQSQGQHLTLDSVAVKYILAKDFNPGLREVLSGDIQTIRNNEMADRIIAIMKLRKNELLACDRKGVDNE